MMVSVLMETTHPICLERFADYKMLGRFTLRDSGQSVAIGKVTKLIEASDTPNVAGLNIN
jgi:peptide chain release factor subunit 3